MTTPTPQDKTKALADYNAQRPHGDINCIGAFKAGWDAALAAERTSLQAECERLREALQISSQLERALTEYLDNLEWKPRRAHIERARNDAARMARALARPAPAAEGK